MEQEPVYVPSAKLVQACEDALGKIYDARQRTRESYVRARADVYNAGVTARNHKRRWLIALGAKPDLMITPQGMELEIKAEIDAMGDVAADKHPMIQIHREYGQVEHEAKDAIIMARLADSVPISAGFCRALSHLGVDPKFMRRDPFGFRAR